MIIFLIVLSVSALPVLLDEFFYPNYFYSHLLIRPEYLYLTCGLVLALMLRPTFRRPLHVYCLVLVGFLLSQSLGKTLGRVVELVTFGNGLYEKKLVSTYGQKYYFIEYLKTVIPKNSRVLIPPDQLPFRHTGSVQLMQAWLYPRQVYTASYGWVLEPKSLVGFDYIILSSESDSGSLSLWPDFEIRVKKMFVYDWTKKVGNEISIATYNPTDWHEKQPWGLLIPKTPKSNNESTN